MPAYPQLTRDSGLRVSLDTPGAIGSWPEPVERAAYRAVQEALTNVRKHAPGADVQVRIRPADGALRVEVRNTAADRSTAPLDLPGGGHGLVGLRERTQLLGGTFHSEPVPGGGFQVWANFPV